MLVKVFEGVVRVVSMIETYFSGLVA